MHLDRVAITEDRTKRIRTISAPVNRAEICNAQDLKSEQLRFARIFVRLLSYCTTPTHAQMVFSNKRTLAHRYFFAGQDGEPMLFAYCRPRYEMAKAKSIQTQGTETAFSVL